MASPAVALPIEYPFDLPDLHIRTVTSFDDFVDLGPVWNDLLAKADIDHPFLEFLWIRTWLERVWQGALDARWRGAS